MSTQEVCQATVKWYNEVKGFGFLVPEEEGLGDIFLHAAVWNRDGRHAAPLPGRKVKVEVKVVNNRLRATRVVSVGNEGESA